MINPKSLSLGGGLFSLEKYYRFSDIYYIRLEGDMCLYRVGA